MIFNIFIFIGFFAQNSMKVTEFFKNQSCSVTKGIQTQTQFRQSKVQPFSKRIVEGDLGNEKLVICFYIYTNIQLFSISIFQSGRQMSTKIIKCEDFMKHRKTTLSTKKIKTEPSRNNELFGCFLYKDQYTHRKYKIQKLRKNHRRVKTTELQVQPQTMGKYFLQELNMFRSIRQNRNKNIVSNFKKTFRMKEEDQSKPQNINVNCIKKQIRKQILNMNQQYLREYLYRQQPFNNYFSKLNKASNIGALNEKKIKELKYTIKQCEDFQISKVSKNSFHEKKLPTTKEKLLGRDMRLRKKRISMEIQREFQKIWEHLDGEISRKVRIQGQYNWATTKEDDFY